MVVWLDGRLVAAAAARIDPADRGFLLGDGLFETMRAVGGGVPLLDLHLARLRGGASLLQIPVPADDAELAGAARELLAGNGLGGQAALRLTLTRGRGPRGLLPPDDPSPTLLLAAFPLPVPTGAAQAVTAATATVTRRNERSPLARVKALGYLDNLLALREARATGADEALLLNTADRLAGAATANLFLVEGDRLLTPPLAEGAVPGVTRGLVLEQARAAGVEAVELPLPPACLAAAAGAFLTSSLAGPRAVSAVDGRALAPPAVLPVLQDGWRRRLGLRAAGA